MSNAGYRGLFSDIYDADQQYANAKLDDLQSHKLYLGRLRVDIILAGCVVLTDTQVLDGTFFLAAASSRLLDDLPVDRIEVRSRDGSLKGSLIDLARRPCDWNPRGLVASQLPKEASDMIAKQLRGNEREGARSWQRLPDTLRNCGMEPALTEQLEAAWAKLIEAEEKGRLVVKESDRHFNSHAALDEILESRREDLTDVCRSPEGKRAARFAWSHRGTCRHALAAELKRQSDDCRDERERKELQAVISWLNWGYHEAIAKQHRCAFTETSDIVGSAPVGSARRMFDGIRDRVSSGSPTTMIPPKYGLLIPRGLVAALDEMDADTFSNLIKTHGAELEAWYRSGGFERLRKAVSGLIVSVARSGADWNVSRARPDWTGPLRVITKPVEMEGFEAASAEEPILNAARRGFSYLGAVFVDENRLFSKLNLNFIARRLIEYRGEFASQRR